MSKLEKLYDSSSVLGVRYHVIDKEDLVDEITEAARSRNPLGVMNVNIHALNLAQSNETLKSALNKAALVFIDGFGAKLGIQILKRPAGQRLTPADWIDALLEKCVEHRLPLFLIGDEAQYGESFRVAVLKKYPTLNFAGWHTGFFDMNGDENQIAIDQINATDAAIVLVGMSMPRQEIWIHNNLDALENKVCIATGALHRVFSGDIPRGPAWVTDNGFEWLYRMCMQPHTWRRYVLGNPLFLLRVLKEKVFGGY